MERPTYLTLALLTVFVAGWASVAISKLISADDCIRLVENPVQLMVLQQEWAKQNVTAVVRHATDCLPDEVDGCVDGNETLTKVGQAQAATIGIGVRQILGSNFLVKHSYLHRTRETAALAFGDSSEEPAITKPCKETFQTYINRFDAAGNQFFVTHSSCINSLSDENGDRLLGFSASKDENFGIAAFFRRNRNDSNELIGCVWPADWAAMSARTADPQISATK